MMDILCKIQESRPDFIPLDIKVRAMYGVFHLLRRGANTTATKHGVKEDDITWMNCWAVIEKAKGTRPSLCI